MYRRLYACQLNNREKDCAALYKWLLLAAQGIWSSGEGGKVKRRGKRPMVSKNSERPTLNEKDYQTLKFGSAERE